MKAKKIEIACQSCGQQVEIDYNEAQFLSQITIVNGKKNESRTFFKPCPHCGQLNTVTSENKEEWGKRKGPNVKAFMFSGFLSCFVMIALFILLAYFVFKGFGIVVDWLF